MSVGPGEPLGYLEGQFCVIKFIKSRSLKCSFQSLLWFCNAIVRWNNPSQGLNHAFQEILRGLKEWDTNAWNAQASSFPPIIQQRLNERYGV